MPFTQGHALVIGVGTYRNVPKSNVLAAVSDAQAVAAVLQDPRTCGYPSGQVRLIVNEGATKELTLAALDELAARTGAADTVFLFYCGHGAPGDDGNFYFVSHDASAAPGGRVAAGSGLSSKEFVEKLRAVHANRLLVVLNTCFSGSVSPTSFGPGEEPGQGDEEGLEPAAPPSDTTSAILATGAGRIIITAAGQDQRSYIGKGPLSIFTKALTDGLRGSGVANRGGFISAFNLYESLYETVLEEADKQYHTQQQPELTVVKGKGPFAVSLYGGATSFGEFDGVADPAPELAGVRQVRPEKAERLLHNLLISTVATVTNSPGAVTGSVGRDNITTTYNSGGGKIDQRKINTGGGLYIEGDVNTGSGDFVGGNKTVYSASPSRGLGRGDLTLVFAPLLGELPRLPPEKMAPAAGAIQALQHEAERGPARDDRRMGRLVDELAALIPGSARTLLSAFADPALSALAGPETKAALARIRR